MNVAVISSASVAAPITNPDGEIIAGVKQMRALLVRAPRLVAAEQKLRRQFQRKGWDGKVPNPPEVAAAQEKWSEAYSKITILARKIIAGPAPSTVEGCAAFAQALIWETYLPSRLDQKPKRNEEAVGGKTCEGVYRLWAALENLSGYNQGGAKRAYQDRRNRNASELLRHVAAKAS